MKMGHYPLRAVFMLWCLRCVDAYHFIGRRSFVKTPSSSVVNSSLPRHLVKDQLPASIPGVHSTQGRFVRTFLLAAPLSDAVHSTATTISALVSLCSAALVGIRSDRLIPNSGILVTLVSSALLSRIGLAPPSHYLYNLCWNTFLPASLVLLLLGLKDSPDDKNRTSIPTNDSVWIDIRRMALPFIIASCGSLLGCYISFILSISSRSSLVLTPHDAIIAAACLSASFVGGSVNFFATAAIVASKHVSKSTHSIESLVSAMAAADLVVTAIYFAILSFAAQSTVLRNWFSRDHQQQERIEVEAHSDMLPSRDMEVSHRKVKESQSSNLAKLVASMMVSIVALIMVFISGRVEKALAGIIPGTACAVIAVSTPAITKMMPSGNPQWQAMQNAASSLSSFAFLLLFAAIGCSADLDAALLNGPACLIFSLLALFVHLFISFTGSYCARNVLRQSMEYNDVLITSNAAIGGPATAATFCGTLPRNTRALTIAATIWGVVGYGIGTTIGVTMYSFLQRFL